jgi:hypothetical protein
MRAPCLPGRVPPHDRPAPSARACEAGVRSLLRECTWGPKII